MRRVPHRLFVLVTTACATHDPAPDYTAPLRQAVLLAGDGHETSQRDALAHFLALADSAGRTRQPLTEGAARAFAAQVYSNLGRVQQTLGRPDSAASLFSAALPLRRRASDFAGLGATLNNLGYSLDLQRQPAEALARYREALEALRTAGNLSTQGLVRINMGRAYLAQGDLDSARAAVVAGLAIKRSVADSTGVSW